MILSLMFFFFVRVESTFLVSVNLLIYIASETVEVSPTLMVLYACAKRLAQLTICMIFGIFGMTSFVILD